MKHLVMGYELGRQDLPKQWQVLCAAQFETPLLVAHRPLLTACGWPEDSRPRPLQRWFKNEGSEFASEPGISWHKEHCSLLAVPFTERNQKCVFRLPVLLTDRHVAGLLMRDDNQVVIGRLWMVEKPFEQYSNLSLPNAWLFTVEYAIYHPLRVIRIAPSHTIEAHCKMGGANAGAVVALGDGGVFGDAALRWTDSSLMPGIQQNARLADNLICYAVKIAGAGVTPAQHCERAEKNLATFVLTALQLHCGVKWWHKGIPLNIRQECVQRKEEEPHREFPKDAYLNLIDLKKIMERNWPLFQSYFKKIGESQSKDKALSWMERFNEIRRLQAHP